MMKFLYEYFLAAWLYSAQILHCGVVDEIKLNLVVLLFNILI
jgi:hypothetical protein